MLHTVCNAGGTACEACSWALHLRNDNVVPGGDVREKQSASLHARRASPGKRQTASQAAIPGWQAC